MATGNLRWRDRRSLYRRPHEQIRTEEYDIAPVGTKEAKGFVVAHHYSGSYPADRYRFGLFHKDQLVGVCVFSHPASERVLTNVFGAPAKQSVELGRLVLLDEVPANGESFFVAHCLRQLKRAGLKGVVSFSDPVPRTTLDGRQITPGHVGTVYQALNAAIRGRSGESTLHVLPDGTTFSNRAMSKIRQKTKGWQYAQAQLVEFGATPLGEDEQGRDWLAHWLPLLTRPLRHPGNHRYVFSLNVPRLESLGDYPKKSYPKS